MLIEIFKEGKYMLKIGEKIYHSEYRKGEIVSTSNQKGTIQVAFEREFELIVGEVIDTDNYFEDTRRLETTRYIEVYPSDVKRIKGFSKERDAYCYSCKKVLSTLTQLECEDCDWILCECGACGCNYNK